MEAFIKGINRQMTKRFDPLHTPLHAQDDVCYRAYMPVLNCTALQKASTFFLMCMETQLVSPKASQIKKGL